MGLRILHTADLHLGAEFDSYADKSAVLKNKINDAFESIVDYSINPENNIDVVIIAGDLFDTHNPDKLLVEHVKKGLSRISDKGILLYLIPGNHDSYGYANSVYRKEKFPGKLILNRNFEYVETIDIKSFKLHIYGGIFYPGEANKRPLEKFHINQEFGFHLGILHGTYENGKFKSIERDLPFNFEEFKESGLNYLALGHYHSFYEINIDDKHKAVYPGSIAPRKITEYGKKYFAVIDIEPDFKISTESVNIFPLKSEKFVIDLNKENIENQDELINLILTKSDKDLILDLVITGFIDFELNETEIYSAIEDEFFFVRIKTKLKYVDTSKVNQLKEEETVRGLYFKKLLEAYNNSSEKEKEIINKAINLGLIEFVKDL